jgi:Protein of unknown function (DUF1569)
MPTLRNPADRAALIARLDRLTPDATPRWGRMNAQQMLAHVADGFRMAAGQLPVRPKRVLPLRHFPVKHLMIYVLPFPKNVPTAPELLSRPAESIDVERSQIKELVATLGAFRDDARRVDHPIFGTMNTRLWGALGHKHFDHHLRQFGV